MQTTIATLFSGGEGQRLFIMGDKLVFGILFILILSGGCIILGVTMLHDTNEQVGYVMFILAAIFAILGTIGIIKEQQ